MTVDLSSRAAAPPTPGQLPRPVPLHGSCKAYPFYPSLLPPLLLPLPGPQDVYVEGRNVVPDVWEVLDKIKDFTGG